MTLQNSYHMKHRVKSDPTGTIMPLRNQPLRPSNKVDDRKYLEVLEVHHSRLTVSILGDLTGLELLPAILVGGTNLSLELDDGLGWVKTLGAAGSAVHDTMAAVQLHGIVDPSKALFGVLITRVGDPSVCLHQDCRSEVIFRVPPVGWAGSHAGGTEDALIHTIELQTVLGTLEVLLLSSLFAIFALEPRLDGLVLVVEVCEIWNKVLDDIRVWQGLDLDRLRIRLDVQQACQTVLSVDVHGTGAADTFTARAAEGESWVNFILDFDERIQDHWSACGQVDVVFLQEWLLSGVRIVPVDRELLHLCRG